MEWNKNNVRLAIAGFIILAIGFQSGALAAALPAGADLSRKARLVETYGKLPLSFEANQGQAGDQVKFLSRGPGYTLFLTPTEAVLSLHKPEATPQNQPPLPSREGGGGGKSSDSTSAATTTLRMQLIGANPKPHVSGVDALPGKVNYFRGNDPKQWRTNVPTYAKVKYQNVWPGIDLVHYGNQRQLEHDFVVAPGGDLKKIRLNFAGAEKFAIDGQGDLVLKTAGGEVRLHKPLVYQEIDGKRREIDGRFVLHRLPLSAGESRREDDSNIQVGFQLAAYDHTKPLVIDPVLVYSSYLGGSGNDVSTTIAVDSSNNTYITGYTQSGDFPVKGGSLSFGGQADVFITKLNAEGTELIYSAILGGSTFDYGYGITIDSVGSAYITGYTESADFPTTPEAFDTTYNGDFRGDVFIAKLNAEGNALAYSTYLGGDDNEYGYDIAVDSSGNAYVTGYTESPDFPTAIPYQGSCVRCFADDAFVTKLNAAGSALVYSTYLGGDNRDRGFGIAVDGPGSAYVVGGTSSNNFPTKIGSFDTIDNGGNNDAFVSKFNVTGTDLVYSTYLGGNSYDCINNTVGLGCDIAIDSANNAHVVGITASSNFPTTQDAYDVAHNGGTYDAFVTKLNANGSQLLYSTYLGGSDRDCYPGFGGRCEIAVDGAGNAYVAGNTSSADFPTTPGALSTGLKGSSDAFLVKFNTTGSELTYSTYLGGSGRDCFEGCGFAINSAGDVYLTGSTDSSDFPTTPGAFDISRNGFSDAFVAKISFDGGTRADLALTQTDAPDPGAIADPLAYTLTVTNNGPANATGVTITDPLLGDVTFVSAGPSQGTCIGTSTVTCALGSLANGASATVTIVVTPSSAGALSNTASVTGSPSDPDLGNNSASSTTTINDFALPPTPKGSCNRSACGVQLACTLGAPCANRRVTLFVPGRTVRLSEGALAKARKRIKFAFGVANVPPNLTATVKLKLTKKGKDIVKRGKKLTGVLLEIRNAARTPISTTRIRIKLR